MKFDPSFIIKFPEPGSATPFSKDICAITDDMNLQILYSAYMQGIFPWFNEDEGDPVLWFSPDPRFVIQENNLHISKSIKKILKNNPFTYSVDKCFETIIEECSLAERPGQDGTWIGNIIKRTYKELHQAGIAHSIEVWKDGELAGGFYGELIGSIFFGESMFTKISDSTKTAFVLFAQNFFKNGGKLIDCQSYTDNMARYGGIEIPRKDFINILSDYLEKPLNNVWNFY